ncbi:MAG: NRDE family protein, partial [Arenimonas sp.]
ATNAAEYGRFNLLLGSADALHYASNHPHYRHSRLPPGVHALSNGDLDAPWPKAELARQSLADWLTRPTSARGTPDVSSLFEALADRTPAADDALPDTGVGLELERFLSPPFIVGQDYGTRASTVLLIDDQQAVFCERRFGPGGTFEGETQLRFPVPPSNPM